MKVLWTPTAKKTYFNILEYLEQVWTEKEIRRFILEVENLLKQISNNPHMFQASTVERNIRKGYITKHTSLFYRVNPNSSEIDLLVFWDNRKDPKKNTL